MLYHLMMKQQTIWKPFTKHPPYLANQCTVNCTQKLKYLERN